jgi:hypothetical protein
MEVMSLTFSRLKDRGSPRTEETSWPPDRNPEAGADAFSSPPDCQKTNAATARRIAVTNTPATVDFRAVTFLWPGQILGQCGRASVTRSISESRLGKPANSVQISTHHVQMAEVTQRARTGSPANRLAVST